MALINPAKSHSEIIIAAVAARDRKKAETYAKKHKIPTVHTTYQGKNTLIFFLSARLSSPPFPSPFSLFFSSSHHATNARNQSLQTFSTTHPSPQSTSVSQTRITTNGLSRP
jgi:hypothetical protein